MYQRGAVILAIAKSPRKRHIWATRNFMSEYWVGQKLYLGFPVRLQSSLRPGFVKDNFSRDQGGKGYGFGMTQAHSIYGALYFRWTSLMAQMVKNLPAVEESWVQSLGQEDPLENGMATHSSILAWRTPWTEKPAGCSTRLPPARLPYPRGCKRVGHDWTINT